MPKRYVAIWFRHLLTDWTIRRQPVLHNVPFVLAAPDHGRMVITAANIPAQHKGIDTGMVVADCRAIFPSLQVLDHVPGLAEKLLRNISEWCLRYTPVAAVDMPDGVMLDVSGCPHLWGGELPYLKDMATKLNAIGYDVRMAMADTIGAAWAVSRYGQRSAVIQPGAHYNVLLSLPPAALRLEPSIIDRLHKLGLNNIGSFIGMPRKALRRRFGQSLLSRIDQALGQEFEALVPVEPVHLFHERLPSLEPIRTAIGIELALKQLLEGLCRQLAGEEKGLRKCVFKAYRVDGNVQQAEIGTSRPTRNESHLFHLFELKIATIEPALGFEVFTMDAMVVEDMPPGQEALWSIADNGNLKNVAELLDRITGKFGNETIRRYLPEEHFWPERSVKSTSSLTEQPQSEWRKDLPRPIHLLNKPEAIDVTVPMPDYPPMLFRHKGVLHHVKKADGPERIEQEWWLQNGLFRDYYCVEDEQGARYWLFRSGSYEMDDPQWFIHGFFA